MPKLIKDALVVENEWSRIDKTEDTSIAIPEGKVMIPLNVWLEQQSTLQARQDIGVWLDSDETAEQIGNQCQQLPLIAVNFPSFMDGRGFSTARVLRERFGFSGELRAIGPIIRDQLFYMKRCGFNAFELAEDYGLEESLASLSDFTESYQAAVDNPQPLFRRRS